MAAVTAEAQLMRRAIIQVTAPATKLLSGSTRLRAARLFYLKSTYSSSCQIAVLRQFAPLYDASPKVVELPRFMQTVLLQRQHCGYT